MRSIMLAVEYGGRHHRDWPVRNKDCTGRDLYLHPPRRISFAQLVRPACQLTIDWLWSVTDWVSTSFTACIPACVNERESGAASVRRFTGGPSPCDQWSRGDIFLSNYYMGAPPSRTNPEANPGAMAFWTRTNITMMRETGPVLKFMAARLDKMLSEFDGLRVDHPHGLVCPWVYTMDDPDPLHAVQHGARLFSSPDLPDHPRLARYAIAKAEQLNRKLPRHHDNWVGTLILPRLTVMPCF